MENGLAALKPNGPPAATSSGMPEGMQEMAAMEVVNDDVESLDLDPKTEALLKLGQAKQLVEAANQVLSPPSQDIVEQYQQQIPQGIAGALAKLTGQGRPQGMPQGGPQGMPQGGPQGMPQGMPQGVAGALAQITAQNRGQGMPQGRPQGMPQGRPQGMPQGGPQGMPQGGPQGMPQGLAGQPVPNMNMQMAAQGGIIGYDDGGPIDDVTNYINQYEFYQQQLAIASTAEQKEALTARWKMTQASFDPEVVVKAHQKMSQEEPSAMAGGGVVSFAAGDPVVGVNTADFSKLLGANLGASLSGPVDMGELGPTKEDEAEELSEIEMLMLQQAKDDIAMSAATEQDTAQAEYERFMLTPEETEGRATAQADLQALRRERFSPEAMRKRKSSAGLREMGRSGLGGFGRGVAAEDEAIYAEQESTGEAEIANYTTLIEQLRADGAGRIEARKEARAIVETAKTRGMTTAEALQTAVDERRKGVQSRQTQLDVANIYADARGDVQVSEFNTRLKTHVDRIQRDNPDMAIEIINSEALRLVDLEEDTGNLMSYASRGFGDKVDVRIKQAEAIAELTSGVYYKQMSITEQEAAVRKINSLYESILSLISTTPPALPGAGSFITPGADVAGGGPEPTEEQLVQLRLANPGYPDTLLIEKFRTLTN